MTYILLYIPPPYKVSGGLGNFKLFFDICKQLKYNIFFCPLLKNIPSLNFITPFHDRHIDTISHKELINYYIKCPEPVEYINPNDIVPPNILRTRNNIVIYSEDVIGNPAEQEYVVRWLHYFPIPTAVAQYNFETDYICFYSDYIYNFYKYVCMACGIPDYLTSRIKKVNICRVFKFEPLLYKSLKNRINVNRDYNTNRKCFTIRKLFPPHSFRNYCKVVNIEYAKDIKNIHQNKINNTTKKINNTNSIIVKNRLQKELFILKNIVPNIYSQDVIREYLKNKFILKGYEQVEHKTSSQQFITYFLNKDYFLSFDPFTFMSIIASLCGCISIIKKIDIIPEKEWINGDPFLKYGLAYGQEGVEHALNTQHLLLEHITNMYYQNDNNVINLFIDIEQTFNIKLNTY